MNVVAGKGLGSHGQGIKEPVALETTINRQGILLLVSLLFRLLCA